MPVVSSGTGQLGETWVTHPWVETGRTAIGFGIVNGSRGDLPALREFVLQVEELGLDGFWVTDHPVWYPDCWITLAALAGVTKRIRLGSLVACVPYRNPLVLARMAADIDALSNGRLVVGLGMGDNEDEFKQMGIALRSIREREEMVDEAVGTLRWLWGDAPAARASRHFSVSAAPLKPGPVQRPRIPILIAGGGERVGRCDRWPSMPTPRISASTPGRAESGAAKGYSADSRHCGAGANGWDDRTTRCSRRTSPSR